MYGGWIHDRLWLWNGQAWEVKTYQFLWIFGTLILILSNVTESAVSALSYSITGIAVFIAATVFTFKEFK
jgi:hypothetical protein